MKSADRHTDLHIMRSFCIIERWVVTVWGRNGPSKWHVNVVKPHHLLSPVVPEWDKWSALGLQDTHREAVKGMKRNWNEAETRQSWRIRIILMGSKVSFMVILWSPVCLRMGRCVTVLIRRWLGFEVQTSKNLLSHLLNYMKRKVALSLENLRCLLSFTLPYLQIFFFFFLIFLMPFLRRRIFLFTYGSF